jgi:hypothetical protein
VATARVLCHLCGLSCCQQQGGSAAALGTDPGDDIFIMRVSGTNSSVLWLTWWRGSGADSGASIATSRGGTRVLVGGTSTNTTRSDTNYVYTELSSDTGAHVYSIIDGSSALNDASNGMATINTTYSVPDVILVGTSGLQAFVQRLSYVSLVGSSGHPSPHPHPAPTTPPHHHPQYHFLLEVAETTRWAALVASSG